MKSRSSRSTVSLPRGRAHRSLRVGRGGCRVLRDALPRREVAREGEPEPERPAVHGSFRPAAFALGSRDHRLAWSRMYSSIVCAGRPRRDGRVGSTFAALPNRSPTWSTVCTRICVRGMRLRLRWRTLADDARRPIADLAAQASRELRGDLVETERRGSGQGPRVPPKRLGHKAPRGELGDVANIDECHTAAPGRNVKRVVIADVGAIRIPEILREEAGPEDRRRDPSGHQVRLYGVVGHPALPVCSFHREKNYVLDTRFDGPVDENVQCLADVRDGGGRKRNRPFIPRTASA